MAEDNDKPENEDELENSAGDSASDSAEDAAADMAEDEDDSDLFEPPDEAVPGGQDQQDESPDDISDSGEDPLGDALAEAAAGDILTGSQTGSETGSETSDEEDQSGQDDEDDDSDLYEPSPEEEPREEAEQAGHQPVLPTMSDEEENLEPEPEPEPEPEDDLFASNDDDGDEDDDEEPPGGARQRYPWLQTSGEEEEEEPEELHSLQGRTLIFVGAAVVFVIFSALIWFLYAQGDDVPGEEDVALVEAPEGPAKVVPDDRGGLEVPDQDKLVYDRVSGQETEMEETLLNGPEEAAAPPESESGAEQTANSIDDLLESVRQDTSANAETAPVAVEEPEVVAAPAPVETAPAPAASPAVRDGTHFVQLGSYGSAERADIGWRTIKNRNSILLAGLNYDIQRADLGARGVVYRLRIEALVSGDARDLCADLKAAGQDCLVVRR